MDEAIQFQNPDLYHGSGGGKFVLTFKQICLMHINRCVINGSDELRGGYYDNKLASTGAGVQRVRTYIKSTRDVFTNSVTMLRALLIGYFDKEMTESDKEINAKLNEILKEFNSSNKIDEEIKSTYHLNLKNKYLFLFEELIKLSKRLNFFEEEASEESM